MKQFLKRAIEFFGSISGNKYLHFILGMIIYFLSYYVLAPVFPRDHCISRGISIFLVVVAGLTKEYVVDVKCKGDTIDLIATYASDLGGIVALIISLLF